MKVLSQGTQETMIDSNHFCGEAKEDTQDSNAPLPADIGVTSGHPFGFPSNGGAPSCVRCGTALHCTALYWARGGVLYATSTSLTTFVTKGDMMSHFQQWNGNILNEHSMHTGTSLDMCDGLRPTGVRSKMKPYLCRAGGWECPRPLAGA